MLWIICAVLKSISHVRLFATPWTAARQAPLSVGILLARILEWVAMLSSRGFSQPRDWTQVSCIAGGFFTVWAIREALTFSNFCLWIRSSLVKLNILKSSWKRVWKQFSKDLLLFLHFVNWSLVAFVLVCLFNVRHSSTHAVIGHYFNLHFL